MAMADSDVDQEIIILDSPPKIFLASKTETTKKNEGGSLATPNHHEGAKTRGDDPKNRGKGKMDESKDMEPMLQSQFNVKNASGSLLTAKKKIKAIAGPHPFKRDFTELRIRAHIRASNKERLNKTSFQNFSYYSNQYNYPKTGLSSRSFCRLPFPPRPFTELQYLEFRNQALIYDHMVARLPVPSNLVFHIYQSAIGPTLPYRIAKVPSQLMFTSQLLDLEPGRCKRTDGKKWRCTRNAVDEQRYCQHHINKGRFRAKRYAEKRKEKANAVVASGSNPTDELTLGSSSSSGAEEAKKSPVRHNHHTKEKQNGLTNPRTNMNRKSLHGGEFQAPQGLPPPSNVIPNRRNCPPPAPNNEDIHMVNCTQPNTMPERGDGMKLIGSGSSALEIDFRFLSTDLLLHQAHYLSLNNLGSFGQDENPANQFPFLDFMDEWAKDHTTDIWRGMGIDSNDISLPPLPPNFELPLFPPKPQHQVGLENIDQMGYHDDNMMMNNEHNHDQTTWSNLLFGEGSTVVGGLLGEALKNNYSFQGGGEQKKDFEGAFDEDMFCRDLLSHI